MCRTSEYYRWLKLQKLPIQLWSTRQRIPDSEKAEMCINIYIYIYLLLGREIFENAVDTKYTVSITCVALLLICCSMFQMHLKE